MKKALMWIAVFIVLYFAVSAAISFSLPALSHWHLGRCADETTGLVCATSAWFLRYWWMALLPLLAIVTTLILLPFRQKPKLK